MCSVFAVQLRRSGHPSLAACPRESILKPRLATTTQVLATPDEVPVPVEAQGSESKCMQPLVQSGRLFELRESTNVFPATLRIYVSYYADTFPRPLTQPHSAIAAQCQSPGSTAYILVSRAFGQIQSTNALQ